MNDVTGSVVLDARLNQKGTHPRAGKAWAGFDAVTTVLRSDFELGAFAPCAGDEVAMRISIEAARVE